MIRCKCGAAANVREQTGWVWDWKTGWSCPKHFSKAIQGPTPQTPEADAAAAALKASIARHPSTGRKE